ncbi:uncharacterized protein METZ01_LOCUS491339, partial [marine metagenome]
SPVANKTTFAFLAMSATGSSLTVGSEILFNSPALSGVAAFVVSPILIEHGVVPLAGAGSVPNVSYLREAAGVAALSGVGTAATVGTEIIYADAIHLATGSTAAVGTEVLLQSAALSGTSSISATAREVVLGSASLSGVGTVAPVSYLRTSFGTPDSVSGTGTVALIAREILYVAKALSGTGSVANVPYSVDRIPDQPVALGGSGAVANVPYTVFKVGSPQAINGSGTLDVSLTHGGRV